MDIVDEGAADLGFNVDNSAGLVTVDHSHNNYAVTSVDDNPITILYDGLPVTSIFRRTKGKRDKGSLGDNSPMLYAFKKMDGLTTKYSSVASLAKNYFEILNKFCTEKEMEWDIVVPMPSSHDIANILSRRMVRLGVAKKFEPDALKKITASEVQKQVKQLKISSRDRTKLNDFVKKFAKFNGWNTDFQMKSITLAKFRMHINPIVFGKLNNTTPPKRILLVDDMVTSGTTLTYARMALQKRYPLASIEAITLLSSSK